MRLTRLFFLAAAALTVRAGDLPSITITTPPGQMKYDRPVITAAPGAQVKVVFQNNDEMPHNIVFCRPLPDKNDRGMEVAMEAWTLAEKGMEMAWIPPQHPRIFAHSGMVAAHQKEEFVLTVPEQPGTYPYVCTFPGHAMAMNGELRVLAAGPGLKDLGFKLYLGDWDRLPDFSKLTPHREGPLPDNKIDLKLEGMSEHFGLVLTGTLEVAEQGEHQFFLCSDDGARLWVDDRQVIEYDGIHASSDVRTARLRLKPGTHRVRVHYFEQAGGNELYLAWSGPKFSETPLSQWIPPGRADGGVESQEQRNRGFPLAPAGGEAVIYRNFIAGVSPRGIAVGYPNGVNVCFDADQLSMALLWRGAFLDARPHWSDRGAGTIQPLGYHAVRPAPEAQGMAILPEANAPWPERRPRAEGVQFLGYKLDRKRFPTFRYRLGDVTVEENYEPAGDYRTRDEKVTRALKLSGTPPAHLYLRAATGGLHQEGPARRRDHDFLISVTGGEVILHNNNELRVRPSWQGSAAEVRLTYSWIGQ